MVRYREIECKSALNKVVRPSYVYYDLNIYRGCYFRCKYCYALYSHKYLGSNNFFDEIFIKKNIVQRLEEKLSSKYWDRNTIINIGSVCDSYQPIEQQYQIMPEVLKLLIKYKTHMMIFTKSDLILRDIELIDSLSRVAYVNISTSITTLDENLSSILEPNVISGKNRLNILKALQNTNADLDINLMPIMPLITEDGLEDIFLYAKKLGITGIRTASLIIKSETRKMYLNFIRTTFPNLYQKYLSLYKTSYLDKYYQKKIDEKICFLRNKYDLHYKIHVLDKIEQFRNLNDYLLF